MEHLTPSALWDILNDIQTRADQCHMVSSLANAALPPGSQGNTALWLTLLAFSNDLLAVAEWQESCLDADACPAAVAS